MTHLPHAKPLPVAVCPWRRRRPWGRAAGFSLIELSVAMAISAIVMLALGSAMVLASRALPDKSDAALASHDVGRVLEQLSTDLQHALYVSERGPHAITFTVADRTGDGSPQRIRYAWSGDAGDPLTWQFDDHEPVELLPSVETFTLGYEQQGYTQTYPGRLEQGVQTLVSSHGVPESEDRSEFDIEREHWIGQIIRPDVPGSDTDELVYWRPTYASYRAGKPVVLSSDHWVRLVAPELNHRPSDTVLAHRTQPGSLLELNPFMDWRDAPFDDPAILRPGQPVNLIIRHPDTSGTSATVEYNKDSSTGGLTRTTGGQSGWQAIESGNTLIHALYGVPYTLSPDQSLTRHHLTRVRLTARASGEHHPRFDTAVHLPNRPGVLSGYWEVDFRHDPTALDVNADGEPDWAVVGGGSFDISALDTDAGVWHSRQTIRTWPDENFTEPTIVHLRLRHRSNDGGAARMRLYADRRDGNVGPVGVYVQKQSDGRQTLDLISRNGAGDTVTLTRVDDLPEGFLDVRLLLSPASRSVHLTVDGIDHGTHRYEYIAAGGENRAIELTGWLSDHAQFKHLRVTVGGDE